MTKINLKIKRKFLVMMQRMFIHMAQECPEHANVFLPQLRKIRHQILFIDIQLLGFEVIDQ